MDRDNLRCAASLSFPAEELSGRLRPAFDSVREAYSGEVGGSIVVCSVAGTSPGEIAGLLPGGIEYVWMRFHEGLPLSFQYDPPGSLGVDRLSNALYAHRACPGADVLIIDAGTAVTVNVIRGGSEFCGGVIFAGPGTQARALHTLTRALPLVEKWDEERISMPAGSTRESIAAGVGESTAGGLERIIERLSSRFERAPTVLATGGAWPALGSRVKFDYRHIPHLTLIGSSLYFPPRAD